MKKNISYLNTPFNNYLWSLIIMKLNLINTRENLALFNLN